MTARSSLAFGLALALPLAPAACRRDEQKPSSEAAAESKTEADPPPSRADFRAASVDGLRAALDDPGVARAFDEAFEALVEDEAVLEAGARLGARLGQDEALAPAADEFFAKLQDSEAVRAALVDFAKQNPELELEALSAGFVAHVDARLTRPEVAAAIRHELGAATARSGAAVGRALMIEGRGVDGLAEVLVARLYAPGFAAELEARLGDDPQRLERRLGAGERQADLLLDFAAVLGDSQAGAELLATVLDDPAMAAAFADALSRVLDDEEFLVATRELFALALAEDFDAEQFALELAELLTLPVVEREAAALLASVARSEPARAALADYLVRYGKREQLDALILDALD